MKWKHLIGIVSSHTPFKIFRWKVLRVLHNRDGWTEHDKFSIRSFSSLKLDFRFHSEPFASTFDAFPFNSLMCFPCSIFENWNFYSEMTDLIERKLGSSFHCFVKMIGSAPFHPFVSTIPASYRMSQNEWSFTG